MLNVSETIIFIKIQQFLHIDNFLLCKNMNNIKHSRRTSFQNNLLNITQIPTLNFNDSLSPSLQASPSLFLLSVPVPIKCGGGSYKYLNKSVKSNFNTERGQNFIKSQKYLTRLTCNIKNPLKFNKKFTLANLKNLSVTATLSLLIKILREYYLMHKKLGYSHFQLEDCQLTHDGKISINIEKQQKIEKIYDEGSIVKKIIYKMEDLSCQSYHDFLAYYQRVQKNNKCNFKYIISLINSYCLCSQIQLSDAIFSLRTSSSHKSNMNFQNSLKCSQNSIFSSKNNNRKISNNSQQISERQKKVSESPRESFKLLSFKKFQRSQPKNIGSKSLKNVKDRTQDKKKNISFDMKFKSAQKLPHIKQSCVSTNFKTQSVRDDCFESNLTFGGKYTNSFFKYQNLDNFNEHNNRLDKKPSKLTIAKQIATPFKQIHLQQVESQSQSEQASTEKQRYSRYSSTNPILKKQKQIEVKKWSEKQQNEPSPQSYSKMMQKNHWQQNIDLNLIQNKKLAKSYISGKDESTQAKQTKQNALKLGQLARVMTESLSGTGFSANFNSSKSSEEEKVFD